MDDHHGVMRLDNSHRRQRRDCVLALRRYQLTFFLGGACATTAISLHGLCWHELAREPDEPNRPTIACVPQEKLARHPRM